MLFHKGNLKAKDPGKDCGSLLDILDFYGDDMEIILQHLKSGQTNTALRSDVIACDAFGKRL